MQRYVLLRLVTCGSLMLLLEPAGLFLLPVRPPTFLFKMGAAFLVGFQQLFGQTLPRMNRREKQFVFLIVALHRLQYLDGKRGQKKIKRACQKGREQEAEMLRKLVGGQGLGFGKAPGHNFDSMDSA